MENKILNKFNKLEGRITVKIITILKTKIIYKVDQGENIKKKMSWHTI